MFFRVLCFSIIITPTPPPPPNPCPSSNAPSQSSQPVCPSSQCARVPPTIFFNSSRLARPFRPLNIQVHCHASTCSLPQLHYNYNGIQPAILPSRDLP
ncbi:hypothetical protein BC938DRAFT_473185 [Jimgerdemannia flammicorona]|uniref:Uncharacterized protein n=1 Tax=Jimgerdemannia flammicorona TaxID=994334 RepID=A0A433Q4H1_9FUNG|nr:hypothetical protein BC938DRAFT_473185 [Jimgerdemannia flammicorona]